MMNKFEIAKTVIAEGIDKEKLPQVMINWNGRKNGNTTYHYYMPTYAGEAIEANNLIIPLDGVHWVQDTPLYFSSTDRPVISYTANNREYVRVPYMKYHSQYECLVIGIAYMKRSRPAEAKELSSEYREWEWTLEPIVIFKDTMDTYDAGGVMGGNGKYYNKIALEYIKRLSAMTWCCGYNTLARAEWNAFSGNSSTNNMYLWEVQELYKKLYPRKAAKPNPKRDGELAEIKAIVLDAIDPDFSDPKNQADHMVMESHDGWDVYRYFEYNSYNANPFKEWTRLYTKDDVVYIYGREWNNNNFEKLAITSARTCGWLYRNNNPMIKINTTVTDLKDVYDSIKKKHASAFREAYPRLSKVVDNSYNAGEREQVIGGKWKAPGKKALEKANGDVIKAMNINTIKCDALEKYMEEFNLDWYSCYIPDISKVIDAMTDRGYSIDEAMNPYMKGFSENNSWMGAKVNHDDYENVIEWYRKDHTDEEKRMMDNMFVSSQSYQMRTWNYMTHTYDSYAFTIPGKGNTMNPYALIKDYNSVKELAKEFKATCIQNGMHLSW